IDFDDDDVELDGLNESDDDDDDDESDDDESDDDESDEEEKDEIEEKQKLKAEMEKLGRRVTSKFTCRRVTFDEMNEKRSTFHIDKVVEEKAFILGTETAPDSKSAGALPPHNG
ncbi:MAG: hypothetical protein IKS67_08000, partial [Victivallales bacterium]|nr:hypothetical protein [Victivallales bacterium]